MPVFVHPERTMSSVVVHAGTAFAVEPFALVRFEAARPHEPLTLLGRERLFASLAVDEAHVYAALVNEGTVLKVAHAGGEARVLASGRERPLSLCQRGAWLAWLDQAFVPDPIRGAPYSSTRTTVCGMSTKGGPVGEYATYAGAGWDLAIVGRCMAWVRRPQTRTEVVAVRAPEGQLEPLIDDLGEVDDEGGFVHLAGTGEHFIVAVPTRSWLRRGVELRRYSSTGNFLARIDFVPGRFNGLDASEHGIALVVERGPRVHARLWDRRGREHSMTVPRAPGPLVKPHVAADGAYFAVGPNIYRLGAST